MFAPGGGTTPRINAWPSTVPVSGRRPRRRWHAAERLPGRISRLRWAGRVVDPQSARSSPTLRIETPARQSALPLVAVYSIAHEVLLHARFVFGVTRPATAGGIEPPEAEVNVFATGAPGNHTGVLELPREVGDPGSLGPLISTLL